MKCANCDKPIESGKTCSDSCRTAYSRFVGTLSATDREMEDRRPGYYKYSAEREAVCITCNEKFMTRLGMSKFCSRACRPGSPESRERIKAING